MFCGGILKIKYNIPLYLIRQTKMTDNFRRTARIAICRSMSETIYKASKINYIKQFTYKIKV